jgi:prephenate dehydrogenase
MFVGGHPMAGSEEAGVEAAREGLFDGTTYVLTPTSATNPDAVDMMRRVIERVGACPLLMDPDEHDRCVAIISHFPHVMAAALALLAQQESESNPHLFDLMAGSFRDMTRVAGSPSVLWRDICLSNATAVGEAAGEFRQLVDRAIELMQAGDAKSLEDWFSAAKSVRDSAYPKGNG